MKMMLRRALAAALIFAGASAAHADTLVLVQGYLGSAASWRMSGATARLEQAGWRDAGHLIAGPGGIFKAGPNPGSANRYFTITLPSEAPIAIQAGYLAAYLRQIRKARPAGEPLIVAGHSAGAVVARMVMVTGKGAGVSTLITIASPNRGTARAEQGLALAYSPVGWFAPMFGAGTLNRSRALYADLMRERPGSLLGWLNHASHPKARYIAIVRVNHGTAGDDIVPAWSQDLNGVAALAGHVETYAAPGAHSINANDGLIIASLLKAPPKLAEH